jgi:hypothetical protein
LHGSTILVDGVHWARGRERDRRVEGRDGGTSEEGDVIRVIDVATAGYDVGAFPLDRQVLPFNLLEQWYLLTS